MMRLRMMQRRHSGSRRSRICPLAMMSLLVPSLFMRKRRGWGRLIPDIGAVICPFSHFSPVRVRVLGRIASMSRVCPFGILVPMSIRIRVMLRGHLSALYRVLPVLSSLLVNRVRTLGMLHCPVIRYRRPGDGAVLGWTGIVVVPMYRRQGMLDGMRHARVSIWRSTGIVVVLYCRVGLVIGIINARWRRRERVIVEQSRYPHTARTRDWRLLWLCRLRPLQRRENPKAGAGSHHVVYIARYRSASLLYQCPVTCKGKVVLTSPGSSPNSVGFFCM